MGPLFGELARHVLTSDASSSGLQSLHFACPSCEQSKLLGWAATRTLVVIADERGHCGWALLGRSLGALLQPGAPRDRPPRVGPSCQSRRGDTGGGRGGAETAAGARAASKEQRQWRKGRRAVRAEKEGELARAEGQRKGQGDGRREGRARYRSTAEAGSRDSCRGTCSIRGAEAVEEAAESTASREGRRTGTGRGAEEGPGRRQARKPSTTQKHGGGLETRTVLGLTNGDPKVVPPTVGGTALVSRNEDL